MIKTAHIYYFTGTGNTLALARAAAEELSSHGVYAKLRDIQAESDGERPELLGVVFPVYGFGPPRIVSKFLHRLPRGNGCKAMVIANAAGMAGPAASIVAETLAAKGYNVVLADWIEMPSNYIIAKEAVEEAKAHEVISRGQERVKELTRAMLGDRGGLVKKQRHHALRLVHWGFLQGLNRMYKYYKHSDKCTGCGACVGMCPTGSIALNAARRPIWSPSCEHCLRCVNLCPHAAIEFGGTTGGKRRFDYWRGKV